VSTDVSEEDIASSVKAGGKPLHLLSRWFLASLIFLP
jgi:hypothetical protein